MRARAFVGFLLLAACGKSRLAEDRPEWDAPTAANGFHLADERTCPASRGGPRGFAERIAPPARTVWRFDRGTGRSLALTRDGCVAAASPYTSTETGVFCARTDGVSLTTLAGGLVDVGDLAATGDGVYFVADELDGVHSRILRADGPNSAGAAAVAVDQRAVHRLVAHGALVYWVDDERAIRGARAGEEARTFVRHPRLDGRLLAVDDDAFYAAADGALMAFPRSGGEPERIIELTPSIRDVAASDGWVYWADATGVHRAPRDRPRAHERIAGPIDDLGRFTIAASNLWGATCRGVARIPLTAGASPTILATDGPVVGRPAFDPVSFSVYVLVDRGDGRRDVVAVAP